MRTSNPALNSKTFDPSRVGYGAGQMTIEGTVNRVGILLFLILLSASFVWSRAISAWDPSEVMPLVGLGLIGGLVFAIATVLKPSWAPKTAPLYALTEGLFLGGVSALMERQFPGVVIQAVALTFGTLFCLLAAYKTGLIRATENFKLGIFAATGGIAMLYLVNIVLRMFGGGGIGFIHESGTYGIAFSVFVVAIAALNLVLDFDFIEQGAEHGAPKYMEWYGAFGLVVTLVWLYLEILRLLAKLQSRD
ncbi:MAG TPA: Bax inhibitor-1/YccA family protein [Longimicrobium sp.]|nr:Bax inhibitor-1/YccA family protein [Longimicrobium sp.]